MPNDNYNSRGPVCLSLTPTREGPYQKDGCRRNPETNRCIMTQHLIHARRKAKEHQRAEERLSVKKSACSGKAIGQCNQNCYAVAVLMMLSKLESVKKLMDTEIKAYIQSIYDCGVYTEASCHKIPDKIRQMYQLHMPGWSVGTGPGHSAEFLLSILMSNPRIQVHDMIVNRFQQELRTLKNTVHPKTQFVVVRHNTEDLMGSSDSTSFQRFAQVIKYVQTLYYKYKGNRIMVLGGAIFALEKHDSYVGHVVGFTMCDETPVLCNYGRCEPKQNSSYTLKHSFSSQSSAALILHFESFAALQLRSYFANNGGVKHITLLLQLYE